MVRCLASLLMISLAVAGCTADIDSDEDGAADSSTVSTTVTTAATTTSTTTAAPTTTTTVPTTTTSTLPPVTELEAGLFCRDLFALGIGYTDAVAYWVREGSPDRMDADRNGIPCETVYDPADVLEFWGDPLPTTPPSLTMAGLETYVGEQWRRAAAYYPTDWECELEHGNGPTAGAVTTCRPTVIGAGEYPVLTALVLDDAGTVAVARSGLDYAELVADELMWLLGSGMYCHDVLDPDVGIPEYIGEPELRYFGAVLYWFMEDRPARMDADNNGIPCETLVDADVVARFWDGGWFPQLIAS